MDTPTPAAVTRCFRLAIAYVSDDQAAYEAVLAEVDPRRLGDLIEALLWWYTDSAREQYRLMSEVAVLRERTGEVFAAEPVSDERLISAWRSALLHCAAHHDDAIQADA